MNSNLYYNKLDINECFTNAHTCVAGMRCENYPGSYRCIREKPCGTGYSVNAFTQECDDIDECALNLHDCAKVIFIQKSLIIYLINY